jgi:hypothetical protein
MNRIEGRLAKLEDAIQPVAPQRYVVAMMDYDEQGVCAELTLGDRLFTPITGETEEELCARAVQEAGVADHQILLVQLVRAGPNGGLAPGFERFAKST